MGVHFFNQLHELSGEYDTETGTFLVSSPDQTTILKNPVAWGIADEVAHLLDFFGCRSLEVIDKEKGQKYSIPFSLFTDVGRYRHAGDLIVLYAPIRYWAVEEI